MAAREAPGRTGARRRGPSGKKAARKRAHVADGLCGRDHRKGERADREDQHNDVCEVCDKGGTLLCCDYCNLVFHPKCLDPPLKRMPGPGDPWECPLCVHDDICNVCELGGTLLCCDYCTLAYHMECLDPPLTESPPEDVKWECPMCAMPSYIQSRDRMLEENGGRILTIPQLVELFLTYGLCELPEGLSPRQVDRCSRKVYRNISNALDTIRSLDLTEQLRDRGFSVIKLRSPGRFDLRIPSFVSGEGEDDDSSIGSESDDGSESEGECGGASGSSTRRYISDKAPWLPLVRALLGEDCRNIHSGVMMSLPGSEKQEYHSDGPHLSYAKHLPPHAVNVFIPLVDLRPLNGPTQFVPTSHLLHNWHTRARPIILTPRAGQCILFDYRLRHRGLGNQSNDARPLLYITYATPSFADTENFSKKRYLKLPKLLNRDRWPDREMRAVQRSSKDDVL